MWGIHRWPVKSPHKGPVTRKMFPFDDAIMYIFIRQEMSENDTVHPPMFYFCRCKRMLDNFRNINEKTLKIGCILYSLIVLITHCLRSLLFFIHGYLSGVSQPIDCGSCYRWLYWWKYTSIKYVEWLNYHNCTALQILHCLDNFYLPCYFFVINWVQTELLWDKINYRYMYVTRGHKARTK